MSEDRRTNLPADDISMLLPWYATGRLAPAETEHIDGILSRNVPLANDLAAIRREKAAISSLHDDMGKPSPRALLRLFATISAESGPSLSSCAD